jgi:hypothetical protein
MQASLLAFFPTLRALFGAYDSDAGGALSGRRQWLQSLPLERKRLRWLPPLRRVGSRSQATP